MAPRGLVIRWKAVGRSSVLSMLESIADIGAEGMGGGENGGERASVIYSRGGTA